MKRRTLLMTFAFLIIALTSKAQVIGNFRTVTIGSQTWMAENLAVKANNGCWAYKNDESNVAKYGYLYDWQTAKDLCPSGWHLPTDAEWTKLSDYLEGIQVAGGKLKSATGWEPSNATGTNSKGFAALPGGSCDYSKAFDFAGVYGYWWSSTESNSSDAWSRSMYYGSTSITRSSTNKYIGYSVRYIKN
jgi:uncharacterized protein (TIGR02145 family)